VVDFSKLLSPDGKTKVTFGWGDNRQEVLRAKVASEETVLTSADLRLLQEVEGGSPLAFPSQGVDYLLDEAETSTALPPNTIHYLDEEDRPTSHTRLFTPSDLSPDQKSAFDRIMAWVKAPGAQKVMSLGGYAGTGKTTLLSTITHEICNVQKKAVALLTPTAKAASVLRRKIAPLHLIPAPFCGTVHAFQYSPITGDHEELTGWARRYFQKFEDENGNVTYQAKGKGDRPRVNLLIVDECSMVNREMEEDILAFGVPVLAVGDHGQLPPVQGKSTWMTEPTIRLERIHRQAEDNPILALATYVREEGRLPPGLDNFGIPYYRSLKEAELPLLRAYDTYGQHDVMMLCFTNRLRARINQGVHKRLFGTDQPTRGSQIICLKNTHDLINGMRGFLRTAPTVRDIWHLGEVHFPDEHFVYDGPFLRAQFGQAKPPKNTQVAAQLIGRPIEKLDQLGALFDYGYAMTVHKAQGSSAKEVFVVLENGRRPNDYARWLYTALTRASEKLSFVETF
jgi:exodeoxyribonuclease V